MDFLLGAFSTLLQELKPLAQLSPFELTFEVIKRGGWVFIVYILFQNAKDNWIYWRSGTFAEKQKFVLLAIDVPADNEQSPRAVENLMTALNGAHGSFNTFEQWWGGEYQQTFSLEIISIEGYIQFLIRTNVNFRDLVESAIFAQYPNAEITEVDDYTKDTPSKFPNDEYKMFGSEFVPSNKEVYPFKTYHQFEHSMTQSFADPLASLLEVMSNIGKGEQMWFQIIIKPQSGTEWQAEGEAEIKKIIGAPADKPPAHPINKFLGAIGTVVDQIQELIFPGSVPPATKEDSGPRSEMLFLSPGERATVESIEQKVSQLGFKAKLRFIYIAKKEVFDKSRGFGAFMGALKQYNALDSNSFLPDKRTWSKTYFFLKKTRQYMRETKILSAFKARSSVFGPPQFVLTNDELATLWHFPNNELRVPMLKTTEGKKSEAPVNIPTADLSQIIGQPENDAGAANAGPPRNLPTV